MTLRNNDDLDAVFDGAESLTSHRLPKQKQRRKAAPGRRDQIRRRAFRVLAILADMGAADRAAVLKAAERLNKA
jgi:hypothetical protein